MPLPAPRPPQIPNSTSSGDIEIEHMENAKMDNNDQIERSKKTGGVITTASGTGISFYSGRAERRAARLRARFKNGSLWSTSIVDALGEPAAPASDTKKESRSSGSRDEAVGADGSARERFGGFGGRRLRGSSIS